MTAQAPATEITLNTASACDLGAAIRALRQERDLTIEALAFAADMHPTYLSGIERGVRNPSWSKLCGIIAALHISPRQLVQAAEGEAQVAHATAQARKRVTEAREQEEREAQAERRT